MLWLSTYNCEKSITVVMVWPHHFWPLNKPHCMPKYIQFGAQIGSSATGSCSAPEVVPAIQLFLASIPRDPSTFLGSVWGIIYYSLEGWVPSQTVFWSIGYSHAVGGRSTVRRSSHDNRPKSNMAMLHRKLPNYQTVNHPKQHEIKESYESYPIQIQ